MPSTEQHKLLPLIELFAPLAKLKGTILPTMTFQNRPTRRVLSMALSVLVICILHQLESANPFSFVHTTTMPVPIRSSWRRQAQKLNVALPDSLLDTLQQQQDSTLISTSTKQSQVYGHLYWHVEDISTDCWLQCAKPAEFLFACGFTTQDIDCIEKTVPNLAQINAHDHLAPKICFLVQFLGGRTGTWKWANEAPDIPLFNEQEE
jgi:hypothetical protein